MKKTIMMLVALALCGCAALKDDQILDKETVFGLNGETPGPSGAAVKFQLGLVRHSFVKNPVRTGAVFAAPIGSSVHADVSAGHQVADEGITMGQGATLPVFRSSTSSAPAGVLDAMPAPQLRK